MTISKSLIINVFTGGSPGLWTDPNDTSREFTRSLDPWIKLAKIAERGKLHALFIADHLSFFDTYKGPGNYGLPAKVGKFAPRVDPAIPITAMAQATEGLGFGITFSTVVEHPYHFARRLASLDLLTNGRIGWNIVSSYLDSLGPNLLNGEPLPQHDERYVKTGEYVDVVLKLLLSSWRDDAVKYDKENGIFADPELLRKINHKGKYFSVEGPGITEPTPQRFPLIIQAGTSTKGKQLAAKYAELVFVDGRHGEALKADIKDIRALAESYGRDPKSIKFVAGVFPVVGKTHEEALAKVERAKKFGIPGYGEVGLSAVSGIDVSKFEDDEEVDVAKLSNGLTTLTKNISKKLKKNKPTKRELLDIYTLGNSKIIGDPLEIADELERWVEEYDVDGFNFWPTSFPNDLEAIVDLLIPELQARGIFHKDYASTTLRENVNNEKGKTFLGEDHPAYKFRWQADKSKEEFEASII
ncbi:putative monooxygenase [Wickerhamomyces ciferrii]|uniref:Monooxygenase n=1 Tax=Wickerhamomyces ciferrii (strain ATCC 14091 / BCRC 22168 / CBS 111 / JCM 3599 / NBRC 0793 / NRRL Y-1031 F-60-10) TaxID=1206466 RepID=K0KTW7_WICCF|nr:putative monooxygenase [Wickerhamomyces ciferrii]CCH46626.1 putative monooxygenase [Wickerhamomyces ciferrii]